MVDTETNQNKEVWQSTFSEKFTEVNYVPTATHQDATVVPKNGDEDVTVVTEKGINSMQRKFSVDQYYRFPNPNTKIAGRNGFRSLNKWEGIVTEINEQEGNFSAVLTDLTIGGLKEEVTLSFDDVSEQDFPLFKTGAIFYWNIGYEKSNGQVKKASIIRFKRMPKFTKNDWDQIMDKANEFEQGIEWD